RSINVVDEHAEAGLQQAPRASGAHQACAEHADCGHVHSVFTGPRKHIIIAVHETEEPTMPLAKVRGVNINYEIHGERGSWIALAPGGRRGMEAVRSLAQRLAGAGYRALIHDRRNCGASDVVIDGEESEYDIWADDLLELLKQHDALPA